MVTIDRKRLICEKQKNKASAEGARLTKEAMLLRNSLLLLLLLLQFTLAYLRLVENVRQISVNIGLIRPTLKKSVAPSALKICCGVLLELRSPIGYLETKNI